MAELRHNSASSTMLSPHDLCMYLMRKGQYTHAISILNQAFTERSEEKKKIDGQDITDSSSSSSSINEDNFFSFENFDFLRSKFIECNLLSSNYIQVKVYIFIYFPQIICFISFIWFKTNNNLWLCGMCVCVINFILFRVTWRLFFLPYAFVPFLLTV